MAISSAALSLVVIAASASAAVATSATDRTTRSDDVSEQEFDARFAEYVAEHPGDWAGLNRLVDSMGGPLQVAGEGGARISPDSLGHLDLFTPMAGENVLDAQMGIQAWEPNAFSVVMAWGLSGPDDSTVSLTGAWDFRDDLLYQGAPEDIGGLSVSEDCGLWGGYTAATWKGGSTVTEYDLVSLRESGIGERGPVWNVQDSVKDFVNQADSGATSAVYDTSTCTASEKSQLQASYAYEGNDGGSVLGVSIGWGAFTVSYENKGNTQKHSTGAITIYE